MSKIYFNDDFEETEEEDYYNGESEYEDEDLDEDEFYELDDEEEEDSYCD